MVSIRKSSGDPELAGRQAFGAFHQTKMSGNFDQIIMLMKRCENLLVGALN